MGRSIANKSHATCKTCGEFKPMARMQRSAGGKFYYRKWCVQCYSAMKASSSKQYGIDNSEYLKKYHAIKYERTKEKGKIVRKRYYDKWKRIVYDHYGHECSCCGETEPKFLTIDHINDDGAEHRRKSSSGHTFFKSIINTGFPDTFRILCFNCNSGRYRNGGKCPHESNKLNHTSLKQIYQPSNWII